MTDIKNILFDLGNVLIDIDFNKVKRAFEKLGIENFEQQFSQLSASRLFEDLEMGKISNDQFYKTIQQQSTLPLNDEQIKNAWNAILLDFRKESMNFLMQHNNNYRFFLLSNTNAIHLEEVNIILQKQCNKNDLDEFFEKAYYSHKVGLRKPNEDIFQYVLRDANIKGEETLFIDDTPPNIDTAIKLGFKTHLLLPGQKIEELSYWSHIK